MPVVLTLGPILFADFEIPERLPFGGGHQLVVKKLVGGDRVVDAMGRDDDDKSWSGRFRGQFAETRARELDSLRIAGQSLILTWSSLRYRVVIDKFRADFEQPFEIPYSITCLVLEDLSNPILPVADSVDSIINGDVNAATLLSAAVGVTVITNSVAAVATQVSNAGSFQGASAAIVGATQTSLSAALSAVGAQAATQNQVVTASGSVAGMVAGGNPSALAGVLLGQAGSFTQLGQLYQLQALLGRTKINVANASS